MPNASSSFRRRGRRSGAVDLPHGFWKLLAGRLSKPEVLVRLAICLVAGLVLLVVLGGWSEPFAFRVGTVPVHGVVARVSFETPDPDATRASRDRAAAKVRVVYTHDGAPIVRLRDGLKNRAAEIAASDSLAAVSREAWIEFAPEAAAVFEHVPPPAPVPVAPEPPELTATEPSGKPAAPATPEMAEAGARPAAPPLTAEVAARVAAAEEEFQRFRDRIDGKEKLVAFEKGIDRAFEELQGTGVLDEIQHSFDEGSQNEIEVHPLGNPGETVRVQVPQVLLVEAKSRLKTRLAEELGEGLFANRLAAWVDPRLSGTLEIDREATARAKQEAIDKTPEQFAAYEKGSLLAEASRPVSADALQLLQREHEEFLRTQPPGQHLARALAMLGLFMALFALAGFTIHLDHRELLQGSRHVAVLVGFSVIAVVACLLASADAWQAQVVPLLLFAMTVAIAYEEELALLLAAEVALVVVVGLGRGLPEYVTLAAAAAAMVFWMGRIRSRSKLIYVGLWAGAVAMLTQVGANLLNERPFDQQMVYEAGRTGVLTILAGFLMTGLLPFVERSFGVLTDLSLLEVGDVAHPLLQELVRRAPGTYNHSINVASLAEAAAESIGGRGLLVRVGAYFHDIGKMLKPSYFVENQGQENRHESLVPAMSTLIIVAHVKEGVELARQYNLPQPLIDLIAEHHGTTLVEYFFKRAAEQSQANPDGEEPAEQSYRYPGPKPSTRESAVLMLADAAESASRALSEPTPARIASLVHEIARRRLEDGQFDECGLTLEELNTVERSLVKSLTAVYHGRVKYPDQRTA
ncbi:MAG: HDIG domain-containing protein [Planctomycetes bacterium]|nr:HDIG domain-containing protein [Planctomycetota bacterium]